MAMTGIRTGWAAGGRDVDDGRRDGAVVPRLRRQLIALVALTALAGFLVGGSAAVPAGAAAAGPVGPATVIGPEHPVSPAVIDSLGSGWHQAAAFGNDNYLVAWAGRGGIRAARVSPTGALLDP